ncbi:tetratricopeptide repeat protein [Pedobacter antarcticus]|uniref:tetratricopeptide repeat protein n=1 Tax=Pedobacter antarcticus TaxID=34086 RepID=UPI000881A813|nr:tetratricopeptide repeat protein [Pedobacter antarcticus]SDM20502.1 Tetratricopeptide repeat-containing protein [Pedobacter antarcticus]
MTKKAITLSLGLVVMGSASFAQNLSDAKKAIDAEQYAKATSMLKSLVSSQAGKGENYFNLGDVYLLNEYVDSAKAVFNKGIAAEPKYALNYVGLGHADLVANDAASAKTNFDKAISLASKKDHTPYLYIGKAYLAQDKPDFDAALPNLQKADEVDANDKDPETFLALGDYYALQKKNSEALSNYLRAINMNEGLLRAKVQIGRMYKESRAFPEAETQLKEVIAADPNYGPAYREIAELYMQWANFEPANFATKSAEAITNFKKYIDLTDTSFDSRLRYAQFLYYAKDYKALETETADIAKLYPNNQKTLVINRLQAYSAAENKSPNAAQLLKDFFAKNTDTTRLLASDYLYLGKAQLEAGEDDQALINITKAVSKDSTNVEALEEVGKALYNNKKYAQAAAVYKDAIRLNPNGKGSLTNYYYLASANYYNYALADQAKENPDKKLLVEADSALAHLNTTSPEFTLAYIFRARVARYMDDETSPKGLNVPYYEQYLDLVTVKKPELGAADAEKRNLVEAYTNLGFFYSAADKAKATELFNKALAIDPANANATAGLQQLTPAKAPAKAAAAKKK